MRRFHPGCRDRQRSAVDDRRGDDGQGAGNKCDDVVEIVVISVTAEPRRIGRVRVRDRHQCDDQHREQDRQHAARSKHAAMISGVFGQVKDTRSTQRWNASGRSTLPCRAGSWRPPDGNNVIARAGRSRRNASALAGCASRPPGSPGPCAPRSAGRAPRGRALPVAVATRACSSGPHVAKQPSLYRRATPSSIGGTRTRSEIRSIGVKKPRRANSRRRPRASGIPWGSLNPSDTVLPSNQRKEDHLGQW